MLTVGLDLPAELLGSLAALVSAALDFLGPVLIAGTAATPVAVLVWKRGLERLCADDWNDQ